MKCSAESHNRRNKLTAIAEPLDSKLASDIEKELIDLSWHPKTVSKFFETKYDWDILAARSVWAFGPNNFGPNLFMNDCLPSETNMDVLRQSKESII